MSTEDKIVKCAFGAKDQIFGFKMMCRLGVFLIPFLMTKCSALENKDYEEDVYMLMCEVNTAKIIESINTALPQRTHQLQGLNNETTQGKSYCAEWRSKLNGLELKRLYTGYYYYEIKKTNDFEDATMRCSALGMHLAVFDSFREMQSVNAAKPTAGNYWVGASDEGYPAGEFHWKQSGLRIQKKYWDQSSGEPNSFNSSRETCVFLNADEIPSYLKDHDCTSEQKYICEVDAEHLRCFDGND